MTRLMTNIDITAIAKKYLRPEVFDSMANKSGDVTITSLLSDNTKLSKGDQLNFGFSMLPANTLRQYVRSEYRHTVLNVCPKAANSRCIDTCLGIVSGMYSMHKGSPYKALIKKALLFNYDRVTFEECLEDELLALASFNKRNNRRTGLSNKVHIRLDVFSDNKLSNLELIARFKDEYRKIADNIQFYDYTKLHSKKILSASDRLGYSIALSVSRNTIEDSKALDKYLECVPYANYSAIVVSPEVHASLLANSSFKSHLLDGDLFDTFTMHDNDGDVPHQFLLLKGKAASKANKAAVADTMQLEVQEVEATIAVALHSIRRYNRKVIRSFDI